MSEIISFVKMSRIAGERFDLVQAGGGNSSVKIGNDSMLIKASGGLLSEIDENSGFVEVSLSRILDFFEKIQLEKNNYSKRELDVQIEKFIKSLVDTKGNRPSIETFLHSILHKYTLHVHPVVFTHILSRKNAKEIISKLFPDALFIDYFTPGFDISYELYKATKGSIPNLIFLKNHGVIFSDKTSEKVLELCNETIKKAETFLEIDISSKYKNANKITQLFSNLNHNNVITYLSNDSLLSELIKKNKKLFIAKPTTPDDLVYNGIIPLWSEENIDVLNRDVKSFNQKHKAMPKVVIINDSIYFVAKSIKKAREMEEVFKSHIFALSLTETLDDYNFLNESELIYLSTWEAEKYRQKK